MSQEPTNFLARPAKPPAMPSGVLHGALLRPSIMSWDGQRYRGARLQAFDAPAALPGVVDVVRRQNFIGVIAVAAVLARQAVESLSPVWQVPSMATAGQGQELWPLESDAYVWRLAARSAHDGAGVAVWCSGGYATVWVPCATIDRGNLIDELGRVLGLAPDRLTLVEIDPGPPGPLDALDTLDAAADAALLSQAIERPVQVPLGGLQRSPALALWPQIGGRDVDAAFQPAAAVEASAACNRQPEASWRSAGPWAVRPSLARLLSQPLQAEPSDWPTARASCGASAPTPDQSCQPRPLSHAVAAEFDAAQVFAQESWLDEQAASLGLDPLGYRLQRLPEGPGRRLAKHMAERTGWRTGPEGRRRARGPIHERMTADGRLHGRGYGSAWTLAPAADGALVESWSAWVAEVAVEPSTGCIDVTRVVVGRDGRALREAKTVDIWDGEPQLLDTARRLLAVPARFDDWGGAPACKPASSEAESVTGAVTLTGGAVAHGKIEAGGVVTLPAAAAIANAIFDATGARLRQVPFDAETLRLALAKPSASAARGWRHKSRGWLAAAAGLTAAAAGLIAMAWPVKPAIAPTDGPDMSLYSAAAIARGRLVAAVGDCAVCHTAPDGSPNAGGFALETPFGIIYSANITPDMDTGIGRWSYSAFERAMREGVHRDGRQLYPAFPYTAFAKITDADMQALYAYLMMQPPVNSKTPETRLAFPYNIRASLAGWNLLFHDNRIYRPDPAQSLEWNRGAYLVEGAGHCSACHTPRNALGATKTGLDNYLAGGEAEGWKAPPLNRLAHDRRPWSADELYRYLRTGFSAGHGVASGPMAPVIRGLAQLPESDVRAMVVYLLKLPGGGNGPAIEPALAPAAPTFVPRVNGERIYQNACAVCHEAGSGPTLFGVKPQLDRNTNLRAVTPDNLIQVILNGIQMPANDALGYMPGFKDSLDDRQIADLLGYLRARFAPEERAWPDDMATISRLRRQAYAPIEEP